MSGGRFLFCFVFYLLTLQISLGEQGDLVYDLLFLFKGIDRLYLLVLFLKSKKVYPFFVCCQKKRGLRGGEGYGA